LQIIVLPDPISSGEERPQTHGSDGDVNHEGTPRPRQAGPTASAPDLQLDYPTDPQVWRPLQPPICVS
jgi:hypothetical protein